MSSPGIWQRLGLRNVMKIVRNPNRWLTKLSRAAALISLVAGVQSVTAQDEPFTYGRTPSGSASEVVDQNRHGLGVLFRGGHMAGDTVGRDDSISHISLAPYVNIDNSFLFGDTRLMRANEGGLAWTFGGGYRHYLEDYDIVLGANSYFDRSQLTGAQLNQWGVGAEVLAHGWEWRGNIYQTFGETSALVNQRVAPNSAAFAGENITFTRIDTFASSLKGFDTETGFLLPGSFAERIDLRAFAGGYMYEGESIDRFGGLSGRLQADIGRWLELGLKVTDDKQYHTTVMFSAAVHFGGFESEEHTRRSAIQRFREPVRRNMHVVALTADVAVGNQIAINPNTGLPFTVAHVNSNDAVGPFSGTVENPFQLLTSGLGAGKDITFVHAGSVFNAPPENQVVLLPGQRLIGEGFINTGRDVITSIQIEALGRTLDVVLPDSPTFAANPTLLRPTLQNTTGNAVTLSSDAQFSGFVIDSPTENGIVGNGVDNVLVTDVRVINPGTSAVRLLNTTGNIAFLNTTLEAAAAALGPTMHINGGNGNVSFLSTDIFALGAIRNNSSQASLLLENRTGGQLNMTTSSITDNGGQGIIIRNNTGGSAIIDNVTLTNTQGQGISIIDNDGSYRFRTTALTETLIQSPGAEGIFINDLRGDVEFQGNVRIVDRTAEGVEITNSTGDVAFSNALTIEGTVAGNTDAALFVHAQLDQSSVEIGSVNIRRSAANAQGSFGNGILITNNTAASSVTVTDVTNINQTTLESILITGNAGAASFLGSTTIQNRLVEGVSITNSSGPIQFGTGPNDVLQISNGLDSQEAAFNAVDNDSNISVSSAVITNAQGNAGGGAGANLVDNRGSVTFGNLDIQSEDGIALFGRDNHRLVSARGGLDAENAAAVDIENSGINLQFDSVSSSDSPNYGIRLVDTNKPETADNRNVRTFVVDPSRLNATITAGDGGTISGAKGDGLLNDDAAGVFLVNAGRITLRGMALEDNEIGILVNNSDNALSITRETIDRPDLPQNQRQQLILNRTNVEDSDIRGISALDLVRLEILNRSRFLNNGDDPVEGRESIRLNYDKLINPADEDQILLSRVTDPYVVIIDESEFVSETTDILRITHGSNLGESALSLNVFDSVFTVRDLSDPTNDVFPAFDDAIVVNWDGILETRFENNNRFNLEGATQQQAIIITNNSNTDQSLLSLQGNRFTVRNGRDNRGVFDYTVDGPMIGNDGTLYQVANNIFNIAQVQNVTTDPIAMRFDLEANAGISFVNNSITINEEGGSGIRIVDAADPARFRFDGNIMRLFVTQFGQSGNGIVIGGTSGVIRFQGSVNNEVTDLAGTVPLFGRDFIFGGLSTGQIIVNGVQVP
jgi:hypothetical protein